MSAVARKRPLVGIAATVNLWSWAEDEVLRECYLRFGAKRCQVALPGRSLSAIMKRANAIGLLSKRHWSEDDDERLRKLWGAFSLDNIAKRLGRTLNTTYWRAQKLGLQLGVPQGYESLNAAVERTGYVQKQLRAIAEWAGVDIRRTLSRPMKSRSKAGRFSYHFCFVDPFDIDEAIAKWLKTEPVETIARRHGIAGETLHRWLVDAGLTPPSEPKRRWRVDTETADRIVAERMKVFGKTRLPRPRKNGRFVAQAEAQ
jgi:hypothetical protein